MPRYKVNHNYASSAYGPYEAGNEVELSPEEAEWLNQDSPGVLTEVDQSKAAAAKRERNAELAKMYERNKARELPGNAGAVLTDGPVRSVGSGDVSADGTATWDKDYGNPGPNPPVPSNDDVPAVKDAWEAGAEYEKESAKAEADAEKAQEERTAEETGSTPSTASRAKTGTTRSRTEK